jgi:cobaltochelatase CobN
MPVTALMLLLGWSIVSAKTTAIGFFVSDGHTGVLAQGINEFAGQYPKKMKEVTIAVYSNIQLGDSATTPDFASFDIVYLNHLRFDVMTRFEEALGDAAKKGTRIIGVGGYDVFRRKGLYNVDLAVYPELEEYWEYSGAENVKRLIAFLLHRFADDRDVKIELPVVQPKDGIYHPDYAANELFTSPAAYRKWYVSKKYKKNAPWIGILSYNVVKTGNAKVQDALIRALEKEGMNVLCAVGYPVDFVIEKYMMSGDIDVDVIISMMMSHPKEEAVQLFMKNNVPILNAHALYTDLEKWKEDPQGIPPFMLAPHVVMPELNGAIEPMVIGGKHTYIDKRTGISITESIPHEERIGRLVARAKAWARLSSKKNADKNLALMYYNHPPGKSNVGASYLDIFASMQALLQRLAVSGYRFKTDSAFTKETLQELVLGQGRNIGSWAPGEMEKLVESGRVVMLPVKKYQAWFKALPRQFQEKVNKEWGAVEESTLMTWTDRQKRKYIVIPGIRMGNVFIGPQPARGFSEDQEKLYHNTEMPPHHQYIAFYLWLKKEFHADAMIHFGTHGTLEWLPGKQVGLSGECAPDILLQDIPDIYPYIVDNIGEGTQAKRRGAAVIISHNVPAFKKSDIYEEYVEIHDNIHRYMEVKEVTPRLAEKYRDAIITEAKKLGIGKDIKLDLDKTDFDESLEKLHNYLHQLEYIHIPYGLHIFGKPLQGEALATTVNEMLGVEGDIPSLGTIVGIIIGEDYAKVRVQAHKYCAILYTAT